MALYVLMGKVVAKAVPWAGGPGVARLKRSTASAYVERSATGADGAAASLLIGCQFGIYNFWGVLDAASVAGYKNRRGTVCLPG